MKIAILERSWYTSLAHGLHDCLLADHEVYIWENEVPADFVPDAIITLGPDDVPYLQQHPECIGILACEPWEIVRHPNRPRTRTARPRAREILYTLEQAFLAAWETADGVVGFRPGMTLYTTRYRRGAFHQKVLHDCLLDLNGRLQSEGREMLFPWKCLYSTQEAADKAAVEARQKDMAESMAAIDAFRATLTPYCTADRRPFMDGMTLYRAHPRDGRFQFDTFENCTVDSLRASGLRPHLLYSTREAALQPYTTGPTEHAI